ncbi:STAS domain-containing protein [Streptomyces sp. NPDC056844]|uniref:STAS domain-containing protein n=1 Tax=unclassified Streptomyces TaxID=2593676 RepID=UPI0036A52657
MHITTTIDDSAAHITPHGAIDHDTAPALSMALASLPPSVTRVVWNLQDVPFMDSAALHLLTDPQPADAPSRQVAVTGLEPQAAELLRMAAKLFPTLEIADLLPDESARRAA